MTGGAAAAAAAGAPPDSGDGERGISTERIAVGADTDAKKAGRVGVGAGDTGPLGLASPALAAPVPEGLERASSGPALVAAAATAGAFRAMSGTRSVRDGGGADTELDTSAAGVPSGGAGPSEPGGGVAPSPPVELGAPVDASEDVRRSASRFLYSASDSLTLGSSLTTGARVSVTAAAAAAAAAAASGSFFSSLTGTSSVFGPSASPALRVGSVVVAGLVPDGCCDPSSLVAGAPSPRPSSDLILGIQGRLSPSLGRSRVDSSIGFLLALGVPSRSLSSVSLSDRTLRAFFALLQAGDPFWLLTTLLAFLSCFVDSRVGVAARTLLASSALASPASSDDSGSPISAIDSRCSRALAFFFLACGVSSASVVAVRRRGASPASNLDLFLLPAAEPRKGMEASDASEALSSSESLVV